MLSKGNRLLPAALALGALSSMATAAFTTYTNRAAFIAAGGTLTNETFTTPKTFVTGANLYNGVTYSFAPGVGGNSISGGVYNGDEFTSSSLDITFSSAMRAWGADFNGAATASGLKFTINGTTFVLSASVPNPGTGFFGVISDVDFTTVDFGSGPPPNEIYSMDNMLFGTNVPAPSALSLAALAVAGFGRRRR